MRSKLSRIVVLAKARTHYPGQYCLREFEPMSAGSYSVYILASRHHGMLFIGVTNDVRARLELHRAGRGSKFVQKYKIFRLVHVETFATAGGAIAREKQLKFWKRDGKIKLIEQENPDWEDRSAFI